MDQTVSYGGTVYGQTATEQTSLNPAPQGNYPPPPSGGYAPAGSYQPPPAGSPYPPPQGSPYPPPQGSPYPPPPQGSPYPPPQGSPYPPQQAYSYPPGQAAGPVVVVAGGAGPVRLPIDYGFSKSSPMIERSYPIQLRGFVSENDHFQLIDEINQYFEKSWGPLKILRLLICLMFLAPFITTFVVIILSFGGEMSMGSWVTLMIVLFGTFGVLFCLFAFASKKQQAVFEGAGDLAENLSRPYQSRGVQYKVDYDQIVTHSTHHNTDMNNHHSTSSSTSITRLYYLSIYFAPGATPTTPTH